MHQANDPTPAGFFRLEEIKIFQSFENETLADVNYYLWLNQAEGDGPPYRFLYALELAFEEVPGTLLLSSGEDSESIQILLAETLVETARRLQQLHGKVLIQRVSAGAQPLWENAVGKPLASIRLARDASGMYHNDALLLDFEATQIELRLSEREGLELFKVRSSGV
jgi:hypothetical protein